MKDKIYVRNKFGDIYRIDDTTNVIYSNDKFYNKIVKESEDIKELVQEGDIVRYKLKGLEHIKLAEIKEIKDARSNKEKLLPGGYSLKQVEILKIMTKERFDQGCFEVVE